MSVDAVNTFERNTLFLSTNKQPLLWNKITSVFKRIRETTFVRWLEKYEPLAIAGKVLRVLNYFQKSLNNLFAFSGKNSVNKASGIFKSIIVKSSFYKHVIRYAKIAAISIAPYHLYKIVKHTKDLIKGDSNLKTDAIFKILVSSASLLDGITAFCRNLAEIAVISIQAIQWIPIVNILSSVLTSFSIVVYARDYLRFKRFICQIQSSIHINKNKSDLDVSKTYAKRILNSSKSDLKEIFQFKPNYLKERLGKIYSNAVGKNRNIARENALINTVNRIYDLSRAAKACKLLKVTAVVVNIIGLVTLLTGALIPLGFAIIGIAASIHVVSYAVEKSYYNKLDYSLKKCFKL